MRNYQINEKVELKEDEELQAELKTDDLTLVEIGPRFVLTPIVILEGSFGGPKIYENKEYVSPNVMRAQTKFQSAQNARDRQVQALDRKHRKRDQVLQHDPLSNEALFKE